MNVNPRELFARRLAQARRMRALSLRRLAELVQGAVSYNALHKYEQGRMMPDSAVLIALADALQLDLDFFFRPHEVELKEINFRKRTGLGVKEEAAIRERAIDFLERRLEVESALGVKERLATAITARAVRTAGDVERAARQLREDWQLGEDAIPSVTEMLEGRGLPVLDVEAPRTFDGFSGWANGRPLIVVGRWLSDDLPRKRFTLLHELAHLLLKFDEGVNRQESLCHRFAGAFLMPEAIFREEFGDHRRRVAIRELVDLKERYGMSIAAIMRRARDLELVTERDYQSFCVFSRMKGWQRDEPGRFQGMESSSRFEQLVLRAALEEAVSTGKGAALLNLPVDVFRERVASYA